MQIQWLNLNISFCSYYFNLLKFSSQKWSQIFKLNITPLTPEIHNEISFVFA